MITVDRETWNRWNETGEWVLFREGEWCSCDSVPSTDVHGGHTHPPAEFVEAAKPCEHPADHGDVPDRRRCLTPGCDGKRRIAVTVPCEWPQHYILTPRSTPPFGVPRGDIFTDVRCPHPCQAGPKLNDRTSRLVTVGHVVVAWGPLVVVSGFRNVVAPDCVVVTADRQLFRVSGSNAWDRGGSKVGDLPPDIDRQSLVGQYAVGGKVVTP